LLARPPASFSTLAEWLAWQAELNPKEIELGLSRVQAVLAEMPLPTQHPTVITVAGTNGKGSTVAFLESIYRTAGYCVGTYTSPHLQRYNERIRINGCETSDADIIQAFRVIDAARQTHPLTFFEFGTLAAWYCLCQAKVDIALLEVGLGGRLDAVNAIEPDVAVVTRIALDHMDWLGPTRSDIGREKAGIFRAHKPAICGDPAPPDSLIQTAKALPAITYQLGQNFGFRRHQDHWTWWHNTQQLTHLPTPGLAGEEQYHNAAVALQVVTCLSAQHPVHETHLHHALKTVRLAGRFQCVQHRCPIILDVAHNPDAAQRLSEKLQHLPCSGRTFALFGAMQDKDILGIIAPLTACIGQWYTVTPNIPRAMEQKRLYEVIEDKVPGHVHLGSSIPSTLTKILVDVMPTDRLVIFGSFFTVAEALTALNIGNGDNNN